MKILFQMAMPRKAVQMLVRTFKAIGRDYNEQFFSGMSGLPIVGYINAIPVVAAYLELDACCPGACVCYLGVRKAEQGKGHGKQFLRYTQTKFPRLTAYVQKDNAPSLKLFKSLGFRVTKKYNDVVGLVWINHNF